MASSQSSSPSAQSLTFYDFLDKMRNPAAVDLVRSVKSFIVSFSYYTPNHENDGKSVQEFFSNFEVTIKDHQLWENSSMEEIDCAMEALEKYVMIKLFSRTFASSPEDVKIDQEISEKIQLLQTFLRPEHLDIPTFLRNESAWLLAEKELLKINSFKAPREKILCIMSCCKIINNLLLNASMSEDQALGGADHFLPVLIYITIKANPPQLHSNLRYIQLYRRQSKLISESAYYFTNLVSAKSFIVDLTAKSLSIDAAEFEEKMQAAILTNKGTAGEQSLVLDPTPAAHEGHKDVDPASGVDEAEDGSSFPYMNAEPGELTLADVERLLSVYKDVVTKYINLRRAR